MTNTTPILALTSGGFDSFCMLWQLKNNETENYDITPLYVHYEHLAEKQEIEHLKAQCEYLKIKSPIEIEVKNISQFLSNNLTQKDQQLSDFYPGRNLMILVNAAQIAYGLGIYRIAIGTIKSSREFYDSNKEGLLQIEYVINLSLFGISFLANNEYKPPIRIVVPVADYTKRDIRVLYKRHELPLDLIYSCQKGRKQACMKCPSCLELKEANEWINIET